MYMPANVVVKRGVARSITAVIFTGCGWIWITQKLQYGREENGWIL